MKRDPKLLMVKRDGALHPFGNEAWDFFNRVPAGRPVCVDIWTSRNADHLALYWSVCAAAARFSNEWDSKDDADWFVRVSLKMIETIKVDPDGTVYVRVQSIAERNMDQLEFNFFFERAMAVLAHAVGTDPIALLKESQED